MSNNYTTNAINIKSYNLSEADKIIVMYSKDHGIIRAVAKGVKKPKSKLGGRMDMLVANKLLLSKGRNLDKVYQADVLHSFQNIRKDISKLGYSMYCTELVGAFGVENDSNSSEIFNLFMDTLKNIDKAANKNNILFQVIKFQFELMKISGYALELDNCVSCNNELTNNSYNFCIHSGGVVCSNCRTSDLSVGLKVKTEVLATKKYDINEEIRKTLKSINENYNESDDFVIEMCFNLLKEYISSRSHKKLKSTDLIESLC